MKHTVWRSVAPLQQIEAGQDPAVDAGTGHWKRQSEAATAGQLRCILPADYEVLQDVARPLADYPSLLLYYFAPE